MCAALAEAAIPPEDLEEALCEFCPQSSSRPICQDNGWDLVACQSCGHVFVSPRMKPERVENYYAAHEWQPAAPGNAPEWHVWVERTRLVRLAVVFRGSPPPADVLEVGCGTGDILLTLREHGYRVRGIELDRVTARRASETLGPAVVSSEPIEREGHSGAYDAVLLFSVLEHVATPLAFMSHVNRVLKPGGKVIIHVPNLTFFRLRQRLGVSVDWRLPGHLHHFSLHALERLLRRSGFRLKGQFWHEYPFVSTGRGLLTKARVALFTACYRLIWELSGRRLNLGSTLNVIAEKSAEVHHDAAGAGDISGERGPQP